MQDSWAIRLHPSAELERPSSGTLVVRVPGNCLRWVDLHAVQTTAVDRLRTGARPKELVDAVEAEAGPTEGARLRLMLRQLGEHGALMASVPGDGSPLLTASPLAGEAIAARPLGPTPLRLSRFAVLCREGDDLLLASPRARLRAVIHEPQLAVWLLGSAELSAQGRPPPWRAVLELLYAAELLVRVDDDPEHRGALACWQRHDLRFHVRSRPGLDDSISGATFRFRSAMRPWPALVDPAPDAEILALSPVDLGAVRARDPDLTTAIESRRSIREHGSTPIHETAVAELLYRCARVRRQEGATEERPYDTAWRPYPGGGACYELEIYPVVWRCDGIAPGVYRYLADRHALESIAPIDASVERLLSGARSATPASSRPQILLVITARFARMTWKYETIAYSTILKDAGVLIQTVYLVATAMGLAVSALGTGDTPRFGRIAGLDPFEEGAVAEMIIGLPATEPTS